MMRLSAIPPIGPCLAPMTAARTWITLDTQTAQVFTDRYQTRAFPITSPDAYNLYRLRIRFRRRPFHRRRCAIGRDPVIGNAKIHVLWSFGDGTSAISEEIGAPNNWISANCTATAVEGSATESMRKR